MFKWQCQDEQLKNIQILTVRDFDKEIYFKYLDDFIREAGDVNKKLLDALKQLPEKCLLPAHKVKNSQNDFCRDGYFNLYRWCVTENRKFAKGNKTAKVLWEYLFGSLPPKLAYNNGNNISVAPLDWDNWYKTIS
ncbi:MAG: hypothetical protein HYV59_08410 [Planctomycetes bacterium]|nr:hypothetical protein [Planctomycetota bacterium]